MNEENEDALFAKAAQGELAAQRSLIDRALALSAAGTIPSPEIFGGIELLARMAAAHGEEADRLRLADILTHRAQDTFNAGDAVRASRFMGEVVEMLRSLATDGSVTAATWLASLLSLFADNGNEQASIALNELAGQVPPEILRAASACRRQIQGQQAEPAKAPEAYERVRENLAASLNPKINSEADLDTLIISPDCQFWEMNGSAVLGQICRYATGVSLFHIIAAAGDEDMLSDQILPQIESWAREHALSGIIAEHRDGMPDLRSAGFLETSLLLTKEI